MSIKVCKRKDYLWTTYIDNRITHLAGPRVHDTRDVEALAGHAFQLLPQVVGDRVTVLIAFQKAFDADSKFFRAHETLQHPKQGKF